jgi:hypothetical protein
MCGKSSDDKAKEPCGVVRARVCACGCSSACSYARVCPCAYVRMCVCMSVRVCVWRVVLYRAV